MTIDLKKLPGALLLACALGGATAAHAAPSLQDKLDAQWRLYDDARRLLLRQVQRTDIPDLKARAYPAPTGKSSLPSQGTWPLRRRTWPR
jgi:hypothetical protein